MHKNLEQKTLRQTNIEKKNLGLPVNSFVLAINNHAPSKAGVSNCH